MLKVDTSDIKRLESDLLRFKSRAYPFATRQTVHLLSKRGRELAQERARQIFILRNQFTSRTIQFAPSSANGITLRVSGQQAFTGSTEDYMAEQEFGGIRNAKGRTGVPIPTAWAAGQDGANPRTKLVRAANQMRRIRLARGGGVRSAGRKQRNVIAVQQAIRTGNRYAYFDFGTSEGIFRVLGGSKRSKNRGWPNGVKLKMAYDLSRRAVVVPRHRWLEPSVNAASAEGPRFYRDSLLFQVKRHGIF